MQPVGMYAMLHARDHSRTWHDIVDPLSAHTPCSSTIRHDRETTMRLVHLCKSLRWWNWRKQEPVQAQHKWMKMNILNIGQGSTPGTTPMPSHSQRWWTIQARRFVHSVMKGPYAKQNWLTSVFLTGFLGASHPFCLPSPSTHCSHHNRILLAS